MPDKDPFDEYDYMDELDEDPHDGFFDEKHCGNMEFHEIHIWVNLDDEVYVCDGGW